MQQRVIGQSPVGANPQLLSGFARAQGTPGEFTDVALVDGVGSIIPLLDVPELSVHPLVHRFD